MLLPLIFITLATIASAIMAYGTHPNWAQYPQGLEIIVWSRKLQWPLIAFAILMCLGLLAMIVTGKRRAWWLIGLGPIVALFAHKFHLQPGAGLGVSDNPALVAADKAVFLADDTYVVGVVFEGQTYAFPYPSLFNSPAVVVQQRDKKFILLWSPYANRAVAVQVERDVRARDLEVVSTPANSTLLYNSRLGEFIVGVTGKNVSGQTPGGFRGSVPITKTTWSRWRTAYPQSQVMPPRATRRPPPFNPPARPILPRFPMPDVMSGLDPRTVIALVQTDKPAALLADTVTDVPTNLSLGETPVLLFRDGIGGAIRAYDRRIDQDLFVRLKPVRNPPRPGFVFKDDSTNSYWNRNAVALDGGPEIKGKKLVKLVVEEDLYWGVMKYWYRDLQLYQSKAE